MCKTLVILAKYDDKIEKEYFILDSLRLDKIACSINPNNHEVYTCNKTQNIKVRINLKQTRGCT